MGASEHLQKGHLNIYQLDHDSVVTGKGAHDRVVAFLPQFEPEYERVCLYCRVDTHHKLGEPTIDQILDVARKDQGVKGRYKLISRSEVYGSFNSIDFVFKKL